jgi:hypothetical protein
MGINKGPKYLKDTFGTKERVSLDKKILAVDLTNWSFDVFAVADDTPEGDLSLYGGEYDLSAKVARDFVSKLKECGVKQLRFVNDSTWKPEEVHVDDGALLSIMLESKVRLLREEYQRVTALAKGAKSAPTGKGRSTSLATFLLKVLREMQATPEFANFISIEAPTFGPADDRLVEMVGDANEEARAAAILTKDTDMAFTAGSTMLHTDSLLFSGAGMWSIPKGRIVEASEVAEALKVDPAQLLLVGALVGNDQTKSVLEFLKDSDDLPWKSIEKYQNLKELSIPEAADVVKTMPNLTEVIMSGNPLLAAAWERATNPQTPGDLPAHLKELFERRSLPVAVLSNKFWLQDAIITAQCPNGAQDPDAFGFLNWVFFHLAGKSEIELWQLQLVEVTEKVITIHKHIWTALLGDYLSFVPTLEQIHNKPISDEDRDKFLWKCAHGYLDQATLKSEDFAAERRDIPRERWQIVFTLRAMMGLETSGIQAFKDKSTDDDVRLLLRHYLYLQDMEPATDLKPPAYRPTPSASTGVPSPDLRQVQLVKLYMAGL